jgi:hypothetical protein
MPLPMSEKQLMETILQACSLLKYKAYHTFDSRRSEPGFPDLVICGHSRLFFFETKSATGRVTPDQQGWLDALSLVEGPPLVEVIKPATLDRCLALLQKGNR